MSRSKDPLTRPDWHTLPQVRPLIGDDLAFDVIRRLDLQALDMEMDAYASSPVHHLVGLTCTRCRTFILNMPEPVRVTADPDRATCPEIP